jgi:hypothetical protein
MPFALASMLVAQADPTIRYFRLDFAGDDRGAHIGDGF